jgi:hypothetical protein
MASSTKISICSNALIKIGDKAITSLNDGSTRADICNRFYGKCLEAVLRAHPWKFGTARKTLALLTSTPEFGFKYEYQLPSDCLFVIGTSLDKDEKWSVEGRKILCDVATLSIQYIVKTTSDADMDALFVEALEAKLALEIAIPITGQQSIHDRMTQEYRDKLREARTRDGLEQSRITYEYTGLLDVRY